MCVCVCASLANNPNLRTDYWDSFSYNLSLQLKRWCLMYETIREIEFICEQQEKSHVNGESFYWNCFVLTLSFEMEINSKTNLTLNLPFLIILLHISPHSFKTPNNLYNLFIKRKWNLHHFLLGNKLHFTFNRVIFANHLWFMTGNAIEFFWHLYK